MFESYNAFQGPRAIPVYEGKRPFFYTRRKTREKDDREEALSEKKNDLTAAMLETNANSLAETPYHGGRGRAARLSVSQRTELRNWLLRRSVVLFKDVVTCPPDFRWIRAFAASFEFSLSSFSLRFAP